MPKERDKIFLPYILLLLSTAALIHHISASDADVMAKLATSLSPTPGGWAGPNFCKWQGVSCDSSSKVTSINLSSKSLSGTIPSEINQLSALKTLSLQRNQLSGPLPPLTNMGSLEDVNLDENGFNSIPTGFLSGLSSLQSFSINNNSNLPPWTIPSTLKDSSSLTSFIASKSNIVGEIPDIFGSLPNFHSLRLSYNNLTGSLPSSFADSGIENLWINNQIMGFSGPIDVIGYMTQLKTVWFHGNKFSGGIPDLSACTELNDLVLRDNELTGVIPDSLTKLPKLQNVALQNNIFQGPMPSFSPGVQVNLGTSNTFCLNTPGPCDSQVTALLEVASAMYYPKTLAESWKGNNPCQDWKFITCDKGNVAIINFAKQNFNGLISPSFANLPNLKSIFLNDNQLEGTIPDSLTGLKNLQILDLSNNNISGKVPSFPSTVTVRLSGNINIGKDVPLSARAQGYSSHNHGNGNQKGSSFPIWAIFLIVLALVIVLAILSFVIYKQYFTKKKHGNYKWFTKQSGSGKGSRKTVSSNGETKDNNFDRISNISNSIGESSSPEKSDYHVQIPIEVIREATDNFNEKNIIGKGGFGVVYRGKLHDGTQIAVKRMESSLIDKGLNEFKAEIEVLSKVKHRHLVALHGFCDNGNERLLVYEYMPQGCLNRHLFHWLDSGLPPLTWNQRVIVALDVARGVEYLHSLAQQSFIHRDLKPSNILLGDDMRAKVSDFGLVKSAPDGKYSVETRLAGTFGYLAPEYAATGRVTTKVDVFAFGIILMEIISGRKALDDSLPEDRAQLVSWFRRLLIDKEAIRGGLDPVLTTTIDEENFQSIWKVAELAGHCTAREPYQRPDMSHAVNVLSTLVEQWTPAPDEDDSFRAEFHMSLPQVLKKWKATDDSSSTMNSDFYNGNSTNTYSTSSNSTAMMKKPSQFTSSFEGH